MKRMMLILSVFAIVLLTVGASDCGGKNSVDEKQTEQTMELAGEAQRQVGMPGMTNFTERKFVKYLYELRDQTGFSTYTYIVDLNGGLHFVCESIGYGIPYSAQFVNPERYYKRYDAMVTLPQPEPNGLFTPDGLSATWVLCSDGEGGIAPVYSEPQLIVSTFPMRTVGTYVK